MKIKTIIISALSLLVAGQMSAQQTGWYEPTVENKPFVRWWWLGSAVDKEGLTYNLEEFAKAGIGGYEVTPIYGVKGNEANDINYLSPKWMEMYKHLVSESERLGLQCDLNNGTGWPFGGPQITPELAAQKMEVSPEGVKSVQTGQKVKRAAPGGEGFVMDHYNPEALKVYLERFEKAFKESGAKWPNTWFNDSYEVYGANWTEKFPEIFKERYGYDIVPFLVENDAKQKAAMEKMRAQAKPGQRPQPQVQPKVTAKNITEYDRAIADYRECLGDILIENFIEPWIEWSHAHGSQIRNQSHGSPANLLDVYGMVDIPECETYGRSEFNFPGLRQDPIRRPNDGDPAVLKFASSAAHVTGKKYTSAESLTWMTEHFRTSLSQCKPELDQMFAAGVNHVYFHGAPYSPKDAKFPGWMFYASINMSPKGGMWKDAPALFEYIERCQAFLTAGSPDSDFLLYFPVYDAWSNATGTPYMMFDIHSMDRKLPEFKAVINEILAAGYDADYISDDQLCNIDVTKPVIVPSCNFMPVETAKRLVELKNKGVPVYFIGNVPQDVPGLHDLAARRKEFRKVAKGFSKATTMAKVLSTVKPEEFKSVHGGSMIRRTNEAGGHNYFAVMLKDNKINGWVKLGKPAASAMIYDPLTGKSGKAQVRTAADGCAEIRLQLNPGESVLIKTFPTDVEAKGWNYVLAEGEKIAIDRAWSISFPESDPVIKGNFFTNKVMDWTKLKNDDAKINHATALYSSAIPMTDPNEADDWILDLGDVRESARVFINGKEVGTAWSAPFRISVGEHLKPGINLLDVYVTNLQSNRIADYDRRGIEWKIFKDANISTLGGKPYFGNWETDPSGLCSEVNLIPVYYDIPSKESVIAQARKVNDYFMNIYGDPGKVVPFPSRQRAYEGNIWTRAVYYEGLLALHSVDPQQKYLDYTKAWGDHFGWNMRYNQPTTRNADNYCCAQAYIDMYRIFGEEQMMTNVNICMENLIAAKDAEKDWDWIDALQMGMPVLIKYGVTMNRPEFFEKAWEMYKWSRDQFFNERDGLWWRDADFCPPYKTPNGKECYWSRGNGWVVAAYVRVLDELPENDPHRDVYIADFKAMCEALKNCQRTDGTWNCSLADPDDFGGPEATGTSLFLYGMAWGVRTGILDAETYLPVVARGWNGLNSICIHDNGFIGYSQGSGKEPKEAQPATYNRIPDFEDFGTGCYLLAASEVSKLAAE